MDITLIVAERTGRKLSKLSSKRRQELIKQASDLLEQRVDEDWASEADENISADEYVNPFTPFIGMFASGKTDTSSRYKEILLEDIKMPGGFGGS